MAGWLEAPEELRAATRDAMVAVTRERYSWDGVARTVLAAAQGDLERLARPLNRYDPAPMTRGRGLVAVAAAALLVGASGCQLNDTGDNLVAGKKDFVAKCGSCHTLKRAGTTGVTGPNLDEAFQQARASGFGQSSFKGIVYGQILHPNRHPQIDPVTGKTGAKMPAKLFTGEDARGRRGLRGQRGRQARRGHRASSGPPASSAPTRSPRRRAAS